MFCILAVSVSLYLCAAFVWRSNNNNSNSNSTRLHDAFFGHAQSYPSVGLTHGLGWVGSGRVEIFFSFR